MGKFFNFGKSSDDDNNSGRGANSDVLPRYEDNHNRQSNEREREREHDANETSPLLNREDGDHSDRRHQGDSHQGNQRQNGDSNRRQPSYSGRAPLDPDDPAVSPMNLWTVRIVRILSVIFLQLTCVWWVVLVVSSFVSPPGLNSRGGGWLEIAFTFMAIGILGLLVLSFSTPSLTERVLLGILSLMLLVDMIVVVSVDRVRKEEGWTGIASAVWAVVMSIWSIVADRVVEWGKREEEQRLTGRAETRRTLRQWLSVFGTTVMLVIYLVIVVLLTATVSMRSYDAGLAPEGKRYFVDDNKYEVHLFCTPFHGNHTLEKVTVLVEGGEDPVAGGLGIWARKAYEEGDIGRYCYWDRPGYAFSDCAPSPLSAGMAMNALSEALVYAKEDGPFILVSHGVGSIYSRVFAARHGKSIKGMLLIDPLHEDLLSKLSSPSRGFGLWLRGIASPLGLETLWNGIFKGRTRRDRVFGRNADEKGKYIKAKFQESLSANSFTKTEIHSARAVLERDIPLVVVSSGKKVKKDSKWDDFQRDLTNITDNLISWDVVDKANHNVWEEKDGSDMLGRRLKQLVKNAVKHRTEL